MTINWPWETPKPGIYFNMPFDEYLAIPCLSNSGIKKLLEGPSKFWHGSWMNTKSKENEKIKQAYIDGSAYHCFILEGENRFNDLYAPKFKDDPNDKTLIRDSYDLKRALRASNLKTSFTTKQQGIDRLLAKVPHARILDIEKQKHQQLYEGKDFIDEDMIEWIALADRAIKVSPHLNHYFAGGYPEVTIIWDDPILGVRFKMRADYLKIKSVSDLKTFGNTYNKQPHLEAKREADNRMYHIQGRLYLDGANHACDLVKDGKVFGADHVPEKWLEDFSQNKKEDFQICFIEKFDLPIVLGKRLTLKHTGFAKVYDSYIRDAVETFKEYYKQYGEDIWIQILPEEYLNVDEFWGY